MTPQNGESRGISRAAVIVMVAGLAVIALLVHRPWAPRPFDIVDFSEFLHVLRGEGGPGARYGRLVDLYVGEQGRFNLLSYAALVVKWELFGDHTAWWHWLRAGQMAVIVSLAYALFRRLDATVVGALAGASLFVVARPSGEAWTRLTMGEPLGIGLMLAAMVLATGWRDDPSRRRGAVIGLLAAGAVLSKEMVAGLAPLVWVIGALRDEEGRLGARAERRSALPLLGWIAIPVAITFGGALIAGLGAQGEGFTTLYGSTRPTLGEFFRNWQQPWQIQGHQSVPASWALPANTLIALLSLGGLALSAWRPHPERRHALWVGGCALALGGTYAGLYLPWPFHYLYYAMPFLLGPALLLAMSLTAIERHTPRFRSLALLGWVGILGAAGTSSARASHFAIALDQVNGELTHVLADALDVDSLVVARRQVSPFTWIGTAPSLRRYALATGMASTMPPAFDRLCGAAARMAAARPHGVLVVSYLHGCGPLDETTAEFRRLSPYVWVTWRGIGAAVDTVGADLLLPTPR